MQVARRAHWQRQQPPSTSASSSAPSPALPPAASHPLPLQRNIRRAQGLWPDRHRSPPFMTGRTSVPSASLPGSATHPGLGSLNGHAAASRLHPDTALAPWHMGARSAAGSTMKASSIFAAISKPASLCGICALRTPTSPPILQTQRWHSTPQQPANLSAGTLHKSAPAPSKSLSWRIAAWSRPAVGAPLQAPAQQQGRRRTALSNRTQQLASSRRRMGQDGNSSSDGTKVPSDNDASAPLCEHTENDRYAAPN